MKGPLCWQAFLVSAASAGSFNRVFDARFDQTTPQQHALLLQRERDHSLDTSFLEDFDSDSKSPVQRVVVLLEGMKKQLEAETGKETDMYEKMVCWCKTNEKEKSQAVNEADVKSTDLQLEIESRSASAGKLGTEIGQLKKEISADEASLGTARAIREKEAAEFSAEERAMMQATTNLRNAIEVLSKHNGGSAGFLQLESPLLASVRTVLADVTTRYEITFGESTSRYGGDKAGVGKAADSSFLSLSQGKTDTLSLLEESFGAHNVDLPLNIAQRALARAARGEGSFSAFVQASKSTGVAPGYASYSARSSQIFGILKTMKDEFEAKLSEEQMMEMKAVEDFKQLAASKTQQIKSGKARLDELESQYANNAKALADAKEDFDLTRSQRGADVEFLSNLRLTCQGIDTQWEERRRTRGEELRAVTEALAILREDDAREHLAKSVSLLQEHIASDSASKQKRLRAAAVLRRAAADPGDDLIAAWNGRSSLSAESPPSKLSTLALSVELDGFEKIKKMMDQLIVDLKEQQRSEVASKASCEEEINDNEKETYDRTEEKQTLEARLETLQATVKSLNAEIADAKKQIQDRTRDIKQASETREKENSEFQAVLSDQRQAQAILTKVIARLNAFYKTKPSVALLQHMQTPPVQFEAYRKNSGSSTVIGLLEQIVEDSKALEKETTAGEQTAQSSYETFVRDTNKGVADLQSMIELKSKAVTDASMDISLAKSDHNSAVSELESLAEVKGDLKTECDFLLKNFDIRQRGRSEEIEAIQDALAILSGAA
jgi:hypothetical protein